MRPRIQAAKLRSTHSASSSSKRPQRAAVGRLAVANACAMTTSPAWSLLQAGLWPPRTAGKNKQSRIAEQEAGLIWSRRAIIQMDVLGQVKEINDSSFERVFGSDNQQPFTLNIRP